MSDVVATRRASIGDRVRVTSAYSGAEYVGIVIAYDSFEFDYLIDTGTEEVPVNDNELTQNYGSVRHHIDALCGM